MEKSPIEKAQENAVKAVKDGRVGLEMWGSSDSSRIHIEFSYPRIQGKVTEISVGLSDVRAADKMIIHYDFDRDGYVIEMALTKDMGGHSEVVKEREEVAFIPAWNEAKEVTHSC